MLRAVLVLFLVAGGVGGVATSDSLALFTDSETNGANSFTAGTVDISQSPTSALVTYSNMAPGDSVIQPLVLTNDGSLELRYAISTAATNDDALALRDQLQLTVRVKTASACSAEDGTVLYGPGALSSGAIGSSATGADAGDRTLAAAAAETLCFKVELPLASSNSYQGAATVATFTIDAEQTKNNP